MLVCNKNRETHPMSQVSEFSSSVDPPCAMAESAGNSTNCSFNLNCNVNSSDMIPCDEKSKNVSLESHAICSLNCRGAKISDHQKLNLMNNVTDIGITENSELRKNKSPFSNQCGVNPLKRHNNIDVVITSPEICHDNEYSSMLRSSNSFIPDKIAESLAFFKNSTSAPLLHADRGGRYRHRSGGWLTDRTSGLDEPASARPRMRLSRDHVQPSEGSLSELHGSPRRDASTEELDEGMDELQPLTRPRSSTCPEMKAFKRKTRVRLMNRPPTPPPGDCQMRRLSGREGVVDSEEAQEGSVKFGLNNQEDVGLTDEWGPRRQSEGCIIDLPVIEEY